MRAHRIYTRRTEARELREEAAERAFLRPHPDHISNAEEAEYRRPRVPPAPQNNGGLSYIANYSKALPHNYLGEVDQEAYRGLLRALHSGNPDHFEQIRLARPDKGLNLTNPQAGLAFDLEGPDAQAVTMPPAPRIDSPEQSAEMGELYWMALVRDVSFTIPPPGGPDYSNDPTVGNAATSLSEAPPVGDFSDFRGPRDAAGNVTRDTLFRGFTRGDLVGPYVSQFLLRGNADPGLGLTPADGLITYGTLKIDQRQRTVLSPAAGGSDFLTTFPDWLAVQRGRDDKGADIFDPQRRFIRNLRDLANYVHFDALYQASLNACLILLSISPPPSAPPFDPGNPYVDSRTQDGFGTFGPEHILTLLTEVATRALKAVWFQKWYVHRRLRPEAFGGRIDVQLSGRPAAGPGKPAVPADTRYPMIDDEILDALRGGGLSGFGPPPPQVFPTFLLPQVFPEGSPTHPAYGAGHATVAGACVTILKAWFDESFVLPGPVLVPDAAGTALVPAAQQVDLTVGGELNKLAANISIGRNAAGVHWRRAYTESVRLGEEIAIRILQEQKPTYNEDHHLTLTRFDDRTSITI